MIVRCVREHNGPDTLLYCLDCPGAYTRGADLPAATAKMEGEVVDWLRWAGRPQPETVEVTVVQEFACDLRVCDADSDALFDEERERLTLPEYESLKELALRSARDLETLFRSVPDENRSCLPIRRTFYGDRPRTAREMYDHVRSVNAYYFGEINVNADNEGTIFESRSRGFAALEQQLDFLTRPPEEGSYGEWWSLRKVLRRFLWHDRIHARAMYRMACRTFGEAAAENVFGFTR